jgi:sugar lactone lactonase YvrE/plastocyanin
MLNLKYVIIFAVSLLSISVLMSIGLVYADPVVSSFFGTSGKGNGQFDTPHDIATDSNGNIYVSDTVNNRIQKFSSNGNFLFAKGTTGKNNGQFILPKGISVDKFNNFYVVDQSNNKIQKFDSTGKFLLSFGKKGISNGQFNKPRDMAIDSSGNIFVSDQLNNRIQKFNPSGKFISKFGSTGVGDGQFKQPLGIAIDKNNKIYVVDSQNNRYQIFTSSGTHLLSVGRLGMGNGQFDSPEDITVDKNGNVYVSDTGNNRIQKFDPYGNFIFSVGQRGTLVGQFIEPRGVSLDVSQSSLYVVDSITDRIQVIINLNYIPDTISPTVTVPADITVDASSESGSVVAFTSSANDETDGNVSVLCSPISGSTFPQGTTTVSCTASDKAGNTGTKSFTVTVSKYVLSVSETAVHLTQSNSEVTITNYAEISKVLVDSNIDSKIIFSPIVSDQVITPNTNLEISIAESSGSTVTIDFQPQTTISGQQFSGTVNLPDGIISSDCPINIKKDDETLQSCIEIGEKGIRLSVSNPIRIVLPDQGNYIPYYAVNDNEERTIITSQCIADNPGTVSEQIGNTGQPDTCYIKVEQDMVIWSSHFTSFGTITSSQSTSSDSSSKSSSSSKSTRPPPQINGIGLFKILTKSDQGNMTESQKFEDYFPYSMHSYISDILNYGEKFVKIGQFFPLKGYSTEVLPMIIEKGDRVQIQIRLYDQYRGFNIEHVALYFTDKESTDIKKLDTFVSYEKDSQIKISDPQGIFGNVQVVTSPEFDAYWAIFDIQFANLVSSNDILIETWNESHFPAYAKTENAIESNDLVLKQFGDNPILKTVEIHIPSIHTSPQCVSKNTCFDPSDATVLKGGIVSWINKDTSFVHAITSGKPESGPDNKFNGFLRPASTYDFQFNQIGDYPFYCAIHPWSIGIIHVVDKGTQSSFDKTHDVTSGSNISGQVISPELIEQPLMIESIESGINRVIEVGKTIILETKNLSVEIYGNVGKNPEYRDVQITIIRPDNSEDKFAVKVNEDGEYFIPTKLNSKWQSGNYEVIATYNNIQIGNIPFKIKSADEHGFGGILPTPSILTLVSLENYVKLNISEKQLDENLSKLGWSDFKIIDFKDRLRIMFLSDSPKQQIDSGTKSEDVSCNVGLQLVLSNDGVSKCVRIDSIDKLFERGLINKVLDSNLLLN